MLEMLKALLRSRKFWLTVVNILILIFKDVLGLDPEVISHINAVLLFLVGMIAAEDVAFKLKK